jgi:MerR family transcriptional regulator, redox-sensitive transcriptional activator SoxR
MAPKPPTASTLATLSIGELSVRVGVPITTLRYWEQEGLLPEPTRLSTKRAYDKSFIEQIGVIKLAQRVGCSIPEIKQLFAAIEDSADAQSTWAALRESRIDELDRIIREATALRELIDAGVSGCGCRTLGECAIKLGIITEDARSLTPDTDVSP